MSNIILFCIIYLDWLTTILSDLHSTLPRPLFLVWPKNIFLCLTWTGEKLSSTLRMAILLQFFFVNQRKWWLKWKKMVLFCTVRPDTGPIRMPNDFSAFKKYDKSLYIKSKVIRDRRDGGWDSGCKNGNGIYFLYFISRILLFWTFLFLKRAIHITIHFQFNLHLDAACFLLQLSRFTHTHTHSVPFLLSFRFTKYEFFVPLFF